MVLHSSCLSIGFRCFLHPHDAISSFRALRFLSQSFVNMHQRLQTHYEVLGLTPSASQMEIRTAFLRLSKQLHPDLNQADPSNHIKFVRLNDAYSVLSNVSSRREYDFRLLHSKRVAAMAQSYASNASSQPRYRTTDQQRHWSNMYETEHEMWSRAAYPSDGTKGNPQQSHRIVVGACCCLLLCGCLYFYFGYKYALRRIERSLFIDRENHRLLREAEERARSLSHEQQLQRLFKHKEESRIGQTLDATKPQS